MHHKHTHTASPSLTAVPLLMLLLPHCCMILPLLKTCFCSFFCCHCCHHPPMEALTSAFSPLLPTFSPLLSNTQNCQPVLASCQYNVGKCTHMTSPSSQGLSCCQCMVTIVVVVWALLLLLCCYFAGDIKDAVHALLLCRHHRVCCTGNVLWALFHCLCCAGCRPEDGLLFWMILPS
jgi:hypothetical protein